MLKKIVVSLISFFLLFACPDCGHAQGSNKPLKNSLGKHNATNVTKYLNKKMWNQLFPHRYGIGIKDSINHNPDFYSFKAFVAAAKLFPKFLSEGDSIAQKRELCAFLANMAQETSGGWLTAPGGYFKYGLYFLNEAGNTYAYADTSKKNWPPVPGKFYYGRGPKQLSWNYNYGQLSEDWYGSKDTLLQHPDWLSTDPVLSFGSALWFWMTEQFPKPSCHEVMTNKWKPNNNDIRKNRLPGFGATVNIINGGVECGTGTTLDKTDRRYKYYLFFCDYFHVSPGDNIECSDQTPFGR